MTELKKKFHERRNKLSKARKHIESVTVATREFCITERSTEVGTLTGGSYKRSTAQTADTSSQSNSKACWALVVPYARAR